jgi:hypothetical protein
MLSIKRVSLCLLSLDTALAREAIVSLIRINTQQWEPLENMELRSCPLSQYE